MPQKIEDSDALGDLIRGAGSLFLPGSSGESAWFLEYLRKNTDVLADTSVMTGYVSGINTSLAEVRHQTTRLSRFFPDASDQRAGDTFIRCTYYGIDAHIRRFAPEMAVAVVTPPDGAGLCTPAVAADFMQTSLSNASVRLALINPYAPRLPSAPTMPIDGFTHVIEAPCSLLAQPEGRADPVSHAIASTIATFVKDGSTIQTGIGQIPFAALEALTAKTDLRLHSGILSRQAKILLEAGALAKDRPLCSPCYIGDNAFYGWLDHNPDAALAPVSQTHAPATLSALEKLVSINSAIEVDLTGAMNAEWIGERRVSAPGGLPNFASAASAMPDGVAIIALPATDRSGQRSRIVGRLPEDREPTLAPSGADIVVTQYGAADLRGLEASARANVLLAIAAPDHRDTLKKALA